MQTAAWWQQKMNTQLAGWAQLRHDNLLYAKQSYTGVPGCMYPHGYVEPIPAFYEAVGRLARTARDRFETLQGTEGLAVDRIRDYFAYLEGVSDTLAGIAHKELDGVPVSEAEAGFLHRILFEKLNVCYMATDGWYARLFYGDWERARRPDLVVADVHTAPADEWGNYVGWVLHAGTGPLDLAVVVAEVPDVGPVAFTGPVMSYYEHLSTGFERLTDEAWQTAYAAAPSYRPDFVNLYLADGEGGSRGASPRLATGVEEEPGDVVAPTRLHLVQNYPNPFADATTVGFSVPQGRAREHVVLDVYDLQGRRVRRLLSEPLPAGHYTVQWDGLVESGVRAASGTYFCRLQVGSLHATGTMTLVR
jgi:hypothetical protein